jgi:hypothetical protein
MLRALSEITNLSNINQTDRNSEKKHLVGSIKRNKK